jgi:hypothetical protein
VHDEGKYQVSRAWIRGSNMGVRIFAVGVLVLGLIAGLTAGFLKQGGENDTLKVKANEARAAQNLGANFQAPPVDTDQPQPMPAGAKTKQLRDQLAAQARAKAAAQAKAEAARKAAEAKARAAAAKRASRSSTRPVTGGGEQAPPTPVECSSFSGNRATGCTLMVQAGFDSGQMRCLDPLWKKESGWNHRAENTGSGAYGIPQALPGSKMASEGADWRTNPVPQIKWGLKYIKGRYGDPCGAWQHSQDVGWY